MVANAYVTLTSQTPRYGGAFSAVTDGSGRYTVDNVPVGTFTVGVTRGADRGDGAGTIGDHGATATVDLRLITAAIALPVSLVDGNGLTWTVGSSGSVAAPWGMLDPASPRLY